MYTPALIVIAIAVFAYAVAAKRMESAPVAAPALFLALGFALQKTGLAPPEQPGLRDPLLWLAEATLALVLFSDAASTDARALRLSHLWPARTLGLGLPLAIALGFAAAVLLLPDWPLWEAAALAAILAPTDAALAQSVVANAALPERVRRAVIVESGLNDGLALPAVLLFASLAAAAAGAAVDGGEKDAAGWVTFIVTQIVVGAASGLASGWLGGEALRRALRGGWVGEETEGVAALSVAALAYLAADATGGNGFVSCFSGGLAFGLALGRAPDGDDPHRARGFVAGFLDNEGSLLILFAFLLIGMELIPDALTRVGLRELAFVLLSLFVLRPAAIWLSLTGTDASPGVRLFLGWFGPRGLATALFALLAVDHASLQHGSDLVATAAAAVALSALLHGGTAAPAARRFGRSLGPVGKPPK